MAADMKKACKDALNFCKKAQRERRDDAKLHREANDIIADTSAIETRHGCQMATAGILDRMCLALRA